MNKRALMAALLTIAVGAGVWFVVTYDVGLMPESDRPTPRPGSTKSVTSSRQAAVTETFAGSGTFRDLMGMGRDIECDLTATGEAGDTLVGTLKISQGQLRSDLEIYQADIVSKAHLIQTSSTTYSWSESGDAIAFPIDREREMVYQCRPWTPDWSVFAPPGHL